MDKVFGLGFIVVILSIFLMVLIGGAIYIVKDTKKRKLNTIIWILIYALAGVFIGIDFIVLGIYLIRTNRIKWGLFWLIGYPLIIILLFFLKNFLLGIIA